MLASAGQLAEIAQTERGEYLARQGRDAPPDWQA